MLKAADCPYCGEPFETEIDCLGGSCDYIEDCPVCCRPIELHLEVGLDEASAILTTRRDDD
jgi:hypothetical protein